MAAPLRLLLAALFMLLGCEAPPPAAYVASAATQARMVPAGANSVGEECRRRDLAGGGAEIYCGVWTLPSARVLPGDTAALEAWRNDIDAVYACQPPVGTSILGGVPAQFYQCRRRIAGGPGVALVADVGGRLWLADGIAATADVMQRVIGALSGRQPEGAAPLASGVDTLLASREAARPLKASDYARYQELMGEATVANRQGNPAAAEQLYRRLIALQSQLLGPDDPDLADTQMSLALQLSNQGRYADADAAFDRAATLLRRGVADPVSGARFLQYRALDTINRGAPLAALPLLDRAEAAYRRLVPPDPPEARQLGANRRAGRGAAVGALESAFGLLVGDTAKAALYGIVETRRNRAWALRELGRVADSEAAAASAADFAQARGIANAPAESAFVQRTLGLAIAGAGRPSEAVARLRDADRDFQRAYPDTLPHAETKLRTAAQLQAQGKQDEALAQCREAGRILRHDRAAVDGELLAPCLDIYAAAVAAAPPGGAAAQAGLAEMFVAVQLVRSSLTNLQIQQAAKRMSENARDPALNTLLRRKEQAERRLDELQRARAAPGGATSGGATSGGATSGGATQGGASLGGASLGGAILGGARPDAAALAKLDADIEAARGVAAQLELALQGASPRYNLIVPRVVEAAEVMAALRPGEAFVDITLTAAAGYTLLLRDGRMALGRVPGGARRIGALVQHVRDSVEPDERGALPPFDVTSAHELYALLFADVAPALEGADALAVSPGGPLLSLPFETLLAAPAAAGDDPGAAWLARRFSITHVPEPGNFLALRGLAGGSRATRPWFGFGDFHPPTLLQAETSFPSAACDRTARDFADLRALPGTRVELDTARRVMGAGEDSVRSGAAFTAAAVQALSDQGRLKDHKVLHFAAHALLPGDLTCQTEPAIVASAPPDAPDAGAALLTASAVEQLDLDAELVILSACNSAAGDGSGGGESLSGLARSFFAAGARALVVTHWYVEDAAASALISAMLRELRADPALGVAGALRAAQLRMLDRPEQPAWRHPFYWAPFALFGEGGGGTARPPARR